MRNRGQFCLEPRGLLDRDLIENQDTHRFHAHLAVVTLTLGETLDTS